MGLLELERSFDYFLECCPTWTTWENETTFIYDVAKLLTQESDMFDYSDLERYYKDLDGQDRWDSTATTLHIIGRPKLKDLKVKPLKCECNLHQLMRGEGHDEGCPEKRGAC